MSSCPSGRYRAIAYANLDPLNGRKRYLREIADDYPGAHVALTKLQRQVDEDRHPKTSSFYLALVTGPWGAPRPTRSPLEKPLDDGP